MRFIELLAPAKDLSCGIAAIDHGADAVYIGASRFGARAAAGNSIDDIAQLCRYAHRFAARVYVTINTLIYDDEIDDTRQLILQLADVGVDAFIIQDMAVKALVDELNANRENVKHIACHASTQTDNRTAEKIEWLEKKGFSRAVLARELTLNEIINIHNQVPQIELEVFVHGALCVSYSGLCYASEYCFHRSANRGECAQFCRLKFDLEDANGRTIQRQRHLLSLKDLCQIDLLEQLLDAGVVSLKIEGRLKDIEYVKNVTAAYSQQLNQIIKRHPTLYQRASMGNVNYSFTPDLKKTFNRGFTHYYLLCNRDQNGFIIDRPTNVFSPDTPKAIGEYVGKVKEIKKNFFSASGTASFTNGDGLCFFVNTPEGTLLQGIRINKVENNRLYPFKMPPALRSGISLYRNNDHAFQRQLSSQTALRKIPTKMTLSETNDGFQLRLELFEEPFLCQNSNHPFIFSIASIQTEKQTAQKPQRNIIVNQLMKLGETPFQCESVMFQPDNFNYFIPASQLSALRRMAVEQLEKEISSNFDRLIDTTSKSHLSLSTNIFPIDNIYRQFSYIFNITNFLARQFWLHAGLDTITPAFECSRPVGDPLIMQCRHCLKFSLGYCQRHGGQQPKWKEPLFLVLPNRNRFKLKFNCKQCQMEIYACQS